MRPFTRTIIELFDGKRRYLVPLYQRQYAWRVSPQLELLWEDIERAAQRLEEGGGSTTPHFMGAIVIAQLPTFGRQVQAFEVIDGQQRLTTFQLLLSALRDVAREHGGEYAPEVEKYLFNDGVMETPGVERFKLWPTLTDRPTFLKTIDAETDLDALSLTQTSTDGYVHRATQAYAYFRERIEHHVVREGQHDALKLEKLFEALRAGLAVVSIELEGGDDPQVIFETLNSRGVELTPGDLMRNFIFQRAKGMGQTAGSLNVDTLYERFWLPLDGVFWRLEDTRGRQTRTRLDWLLVDHLAMQQAELISVDTLFDGYRRWILNAKPFANVEDELSAIAASAEIHRQIVEQSPENPLGRFGRFARAFDVSTAMPLVLYLTTEVDASGAELASMLALIESYIIRRDICGLPTGNYNRFFIETIARMRQEGSGTLNALRSVLSHGQADINRWPDDIEWRRQWLGRDQYKNSRQPRLRHILETIEHQRRAGQGEIIAIRSDLTIEHVMPQQWRRNWPVPGFDHLPPGEIDPDQLAREVERDMSIHKMGNLTLLTSKLNAQVSNGPFSVKLPAVRAHAALTINRDLNEYDMWDEASIAQRGNALFETARVIWSAPNG